MMAGKSQLTVKSALRTLDIIEFVVAHPGGVVAQEIAAALHIPVSSLSYLLGTLVERGYLRREGRRHLPGQGLNRLRMPVDTLSLAERVGPQVKALRQYLNETASFFVLSNWELEAIVTETAEQSLRYSIAVGSKTPLHCFAAGKALLATLDETTLDHYFRETDRVAYTPRTICDETTLRKELTTVRQSGFATTDEEYTPGVCGISVAVTASGVTLGALAVAVPKPRLVEAATARIREMLSRAADALSRQHWPAPGIA